MRSLRAGCVVLLLVTSLLVVSMLVNAERARSLAGGSSLAGDSNTSLILLVSPVGPTPVTPKGPAATPAPAMPTSAPGKVATPAPPSSGPCSTLAIVGLLPAGLWVYAFLQKLR